MNIALPSDTFTGIPPDHHLVVCMRGLAHDKRDKIFRWPHWEPCFHALDPIVRGYPFVRLTSLQAERIVLKYNDDGTRRVTSKKLPTGGRRKWTYEANHEVSTWWLDRDDLDVHLREHWIEAGTSSSPKGGWDVYVSVRDRDEYPEARFNQTVHVFVSPAARQALGREALVATLDVLAREGRAVTADMTHRPWVHDRPAGVTIYRDLLIDRDYSGRQDALTLLDNAWAPWVGVLA
jgi:hypothetical protein